MSLAIDIDDVTAVLLADGWHYVYKKSFALDSYEFMHGEQLEHGGGNSGVCATGFSFIERDQSATAVEEQISGPLTSIIAVRH
jgi:hypothetical protein